MTFYGMRLVDSTSDFTFMFVFLWNKMEVDMSHDSIQKRKTIPAALVVKIIILDSGHM